MSLDERYNYLLYNRERVVNKINEIETISKAEENSELAATANYYRFISLLFLSILLVLLLLKYSVTEEQVGGGKEMFSNEVMFLVGVAILFLFLSKTNHDFIAYILVCFLIIIYVFLKIKLLNNK
jgi:hypothetical protein